MAENVGVDLSLRWQQAVLIFTNYSLEKNSGTVNLSSHMLGYQTTLPKSETLEEVGGIFKWYITLLRVCKTRTS